MQDYIDRKRKAATILLFLLLKQYFNFSPRQTIPIRNWAIFCKFPTINIAR